MLRVPYQELLDTLSRVLLGLGFDVPRGRLCAQLFAEASRDGVSSHGLNRFPRFVSMIKRGIVDIRAVPELMQGCGSLERWNGNGGPGNLNAYTCMGRAIEVSHTHGVACVALANTNHWMRGGSYGWQAADAGVIGICWTNTLPNLPPWGASDPRVGNNPLVIAVPRVGGHVVLDMAMSQFSYGSLANYRMRGELLPVEGGFDVEGRLTRDPGAIEKSQRPLPIGFWKGSGLALMLDLVAAALSGGLATHQIAPDPDHETGLSQVFITLDPSRLAPEISASHVAEQVIEHFQSSHSSSESVRYPGQRVLELREENMANGIPVDAAVWREVHALLLI